MALLPLSGVVLCFSQKGTFLSPVCSLVLDVHVKQHEMHMLCCPTEASYVTLLDRALSIPEKEIDSNDKRY